MQWMKPLMLSLVVMACRQAPVNPPFEEQDLAAFVNPMVGTSRMGHTYPGATVPFGSVQLSPQTAFEPVLDSAGRYNSATYAYCAGYQYGDSAILGFAHTAFSGTGHSDLGDVLIMPVVGVERLEGQETVELGSSFRHSTERVEPGHYQVRLDRYQVDAELTATQRVGVHRYAYPAGESAQVVLDLAYNIYHHEGKNVWTSLRVENDSTLTGWRQTQGWARTRVVHFAIRLSEPLRHYQSMRRNDLAYNGFYRRFNEQDGFPEFAGRDVRMLLDFGVLEQPLTLHVALSGVSRAGALANLEAESQSFDATVTSARSAWNAELNRVQVESLTEQDQRTFYTAMYHSMLSPVVYEDVDGQYRGLDGDVHASTDFTNHTVFSLWDTFRALHPWMNLVHPQRSRDCVHSMLAHADQSVHGMLPIWSHYGNENWCMIGYHAVSVLADAVVKGVWNGSAAALEAAVRTAGVRHFDGLDGYLDWGYFPDGMSHSPVSKTVEIAYDDWCIAQLASAAGSESLQLEFEERARAFEEVWDAQVGFMRPRNAAGEFRPDFDPLDTHGQGFIEGNAWTYSLYVPQDPERLIELHGGAERFADHLDSLFTMELPDRYFEHTEDITRDGIVGNYVHGNEPGHHIPYLYNWAGRADRTQERVRHLCRAMYSDGVDGLCGNDDAGQMSAWYLFSALGFYPVCPGSTTYALGSPMVQSATLHLEDGKTLRIVAEGQAEDAVFVDAVFWNGEEIQAPFLDHKDLVQGGLLRFVMASSRPSAE